MKIWVLQKIFKKRRTFQTFLYDRAQLDAPVPLISFIQFLNLPKAPHLN
jgi:hypothetical protein